MRFLCSSVYSTTEIEHHVSEIHTDMVVSGAIILFPHPLQGEKGLVIDFLVVLSQCVSLTIMCLYDSYITGLGDTLVRWCHNNSYEPILVVWVFPLCWQQAKVVITKYLTDVLVCII